MNSVSTNRTTRQEDSRTAFRGILPFDARGEIDGNGDDGGDDTPNPPCGGMVIRLSDGVEPVEPGFTVAAIEDIGEEDPRSFQFVSGTLTFVSDATRLARTVASHPRAFVIPATHVVVNDHRGTEVCRFPLLKVAA